MDCIRNAVRNAGGNWHKALKNIRDGNNEDEKAQLRRAMQHKTVLLAEWEAHVTGAAGAAGAVGAAGAAAEVVFPCREDVYYGSRAEQDDAFNEKYTLSTFEQEFLLGLGCSKFALRPEMHLPLSNWFVARVFKSTHLYEYFAQPVDAGAFGEDEPLRAVVKGKRGSDMLDGLERIAQYLPPHLRLVYFTAPQAGADDDDDSAVRKVVRRDADLSDGHLAATQCFLRLLQSAQTWNQMEQRMRDVNTGAADRRSYALLVVREKRIFAQHLARLSAYTYRPEYHELALPTRPKRYQSAVALVRAESRGSARGSKE